MFAKKLNFGTSILTCRHICDDSILPGSCGGGAYGIAIGWPSSPDVGQLVGFAGVAWR